MYKSRSTSLLSMSVLIVRLIRSTRSSPPWTDAKAFSKNVGFGTHFARLAGRGGAALSQRHQSVAEVEEEEEEEEGTAVVPWS